MKRLENQIARFFNTSNNHLYRLTYKCPLCNQLISSEPFEAKYDDLPVLLGKVVQNQRFAGNPILHDKPMNIPHQCKDGSAGLAVFAGFKKV